MTPFALFLLSACPLVLFAAAAAGFEAESLSVPGPTRATAPGRIAVLGDSLAVSPTRADAFPAHLQARLDARQLLWSIENHGVRGDTTAGGLRRLDAVLATKPDILIVSLGANDGLRGVETTIIARNLGEIVERAQARRVKVLLCGMETLPHHGWSYTLAFHYVFPRLAERYRLPLVPFLLAGVALIPEMNGPDLVHPNGAGAKIIAQTVWPFLETLIGEIRSTRETGETRGGRGSSSGRLFE